MRAQQPPFGAVEVTPYASLNNLFQECHFCLALVALVPIRVGTRQHFSLLMPSEANSCKNSTSSPSDSQAQPLPSIQTQLEQSALKYGMGLFTTIFQVDFSRGNSGYLGELVTSPAQLHKQFCS